MKLFPRTPSPRAVHRQRRVPRLPHQSRHRKKITKPVVDQTAQVIIFCYHRLVDKIHTPWTEITPAAFEAQMKALKDRGITVIPMQDLLAWKRSEKNIPPRCAVVTFDDGWKSQYEVAWPIMKKYGYPFTMFIYTEGVRGGTLGGGEAITWEQLADMRDNGIDIEAHSATHQDLREGHNIMLVSGGKRTKTKLTGPQYEQWMQNEVVGSKQLLEQRLGIKVNCFAVPFGSYNEHVKDIARGAGYEAMFTVYGQPITFTSPLDSIGRYAIEANKPKVFEDALKMIGTSSGGAAAVAEVGAKDLATQPADGETVRTALPLIKANLSGVGQIEPGSVQMRVSGLGVVPANYDPKTGTVSYQVTQKLRDKSCTVIVSAKSEGKKVEAHWTFGIEEGATGGGTSGKASSDAKKISASPSSVRRGLLEKAPVLRRRNTFRSCFHNSATSFRIFSKSCAGTALSAKPNVDAALRQVRLALLEADVDFQVARRFIARVKEKALGETVLRSITPGQQIVKIFHDELTALLGGDSAPLRSRRQGPHPDGWSERVRQDDFLGEAGGFFKKTGHFPILVPCDLQRPAAIEQLVTLGKQIDVPVHAPEPNEKNVQRAVAAAVRSARHARRD